MSSAKKDRQAILRDLSLAMRRSGTQSSLFGGAIAARIGLSSSDFECLDIIALEGAVTPGRLAEATGLTTGAITGVIDRLEAAGFVRREADPKDRRRVLVRSITEASRVIGAYYQSLQKKLFALIDDLDTDELARLLALYNEVNAVFADEIQSLKQATDAAPKKPPRRRRAKGASA